ncbi:uncharacterized protein CMC5_077000 [Chondromyces crocatus]|uniref:TonB C-terminal domain-containing protein n=2 Tax=Chondromyces crocatus TaxID=52 RepID=A0A0K1ES72_CHOCO|nr:uncharacterized protein CMC5_077000 [Chondromyces crocatus]
MPAAARPASPAAGDPLGGPGFHDDEFDAVRAGTLVVGTGSPDRTPVSAGAGQSMTTGPGKLPQEVIRRVVQAQVRGIHACYVAALARDPLLEGRVTLRFTIGKDGRVTQVRGLAARMMDTAMVRCVQAAFERMTFPPPEGGEVTTTTHFRFASPEMP